MSTRSILSFEIYEQALGELIPDAIQHRFFARILCWELLAAMHEAIPPSEAVSIEDCC